MISVMNNESELDRKSDVAADLPFFGVQSPEQTRVPGDAGTEQHVDCPVENAVGGTNCLTVESEGVRVYPELDVEASENKMELRLSDAGVSASRLSDGNCFSAARNEEETKTVSAEARFFSGLDSQGGNKKMVEDLFFEDKDEKLRFGGGADTSAVRSTGVELLTTKTEAARVSSGDTKGDEELVQDRVALNFEISYSKVDEDSATEEQEAFGAETEKVLSYGFEPGDMVWGKVKSHPWWPGHIFTEAFASPSVRRMKREGHVLVAFFGDSSYGWFDPAELIPFEPYFSEKSRQTNSRNFLKAVEEAIDEASRRRAIGLVCRCRNPFNFRPTNVQRYVSVDVGGYEPGVYSMRQIKKARDSFQPVETLSFAQQSALMPHSSDPNNIDWLKKLATCLAYRRAVFEEFDETYAQAFGVQPVRPSRDSMEVLEQAVKMPSRAPLSGPLVIAEALGERKSFTKSKSKDQSKKDKYMLKRRDEPNDPRTHKRIQAQTNSLNQSSFKEGATASAVGDFVLQKRAAAVTVKPQAPGRLEGIETISVENSALNRVETGQEATIKDKKSVLDDEKSSLDKDIGYLQEMKGRMESNVNSGESGPTVKVSEYSGSSRNLDRATVYDFDLWLLQQESSTVVGSKPEESTKLSRVVEEAFEQPNSNMPETVQDSHEQGQVSSLPVIRPGEDLKSEKSITREKKKKKKESSQEPSSDRPQKRQKSAKDGESARKSAGKSIGIGLPLVEKNSQMDPLKKEDGAGIIFSPSDPTVDVESIELPQLVDDLLALALNPFHGIERNSPSVVRQAFLRFRSLVYQKSLVLASQTDSGSSDLRNNRSPASTGAADSPSSEDTKDLSSVSKSSQKHLLKSDDPTKAGRKRSPSGRQEEMSAKRAKKLNDLKSMAVEKKAGIQKTQEVPRERKEPLAKPIQSEPVKRPDPPVRVAEPTMLVMKFPPGTTLPSVPELKARFARFGPLDHSATRVFWKSSTCRIVFRHKNHAQAAHNYAIRNNLLFGNVKVNYYLRQLEAPASELPESGKRRTEDTSSEVPQFRNSGASDFPVKARLTPPQQLPPHPSVQLKSCLKKPTGDEPGPTTVTPRENQRVKFKLGEEESNNADGGHQSSSSSSLGMDNNSKNFQKLVSSPLPPLLPLPTRFTDIVHETSRVSHFPKALHHQNLQFNEVVVEPRNNSNIDISRQMLSLLMKCSDIVTDVKSSLGYVPYHPL